jgi:hypothetical protein
MVNFKMSFFIMVSTLLLINLINSKVLPKSIAVLDEEDNSEFQDPANKNRELSKIVEEKASDNRRLTSINWKQFFNIFILPILVIGGIVGLIVSLLLSFNIPVGLMPI